MYIHLHFLTLYQCIGRCWGVRDDACQGYATLLGGSGGLRKKVANTDSSGAKSYKE